MSDNDRNRVLTRASKRHLNCNSKATNTTPSLTTATTTSTTTTTATSVAAAGTITNTTATTIAEIDGKKNEIIQRDVQDTLENDLCCVICQDIYINPLVLNCSHSFCKFCVYRWLSKHKGCPQCRIRCTFHAENLVLRNVINKMVLKSSQQFQLNRTNSVNQRLKDEEQQEKDGAFSRLVLKHNSHQQQMERALEQRTTEIIINNGTTSARFLPTLFRGSEEDGPFESGEVTNASSSESSNSGSSSEDTSLDARNRASALEEMDWRILGHRWLDAMEDEEVVIESSDIDTESLDWTGAEMSVEDISSDSTDSDYELDIEPDSETIDETEDADEDLATDDEDSDDNSNDNGSSDDDDDDDDNDGDNGHEDDDDNDDTGDDDDTDIDSDGPNVTHFFASESSSSSSSFVSLLSQAARSPNLLFSSPSTLSPASSPGVRPDLAESSRVIEYLMTDSDSDF